MEFGKVGVVWMENRHIGFRLSNHWYTIGGQQVCSKNKYTEMEIDFIKRNK